jgi:hypothetical protein
MADSASGGPTLTAVRGTNGVHNCFYALHEREHRTYWGGASLSFQDDHPFV